jgi:hypothetical protein
MLNEPPMIDARPRFGSGHERLCRRREWHSGKEEGPPGLDGPPSTCSRDLSLGRASNLARDCRTGW